MHHGYGDLLINKILFFLLLLLSIGGAARAQLVLPTSPAGAVIVPIDSNGWRNFKVPVAQNITSFTINGTPAPAQAQITVIFTQNPVGGFSVTFGAGIASACAVSTIPQATTLCQFNYDGTTSTWIGSSGSATFSSINRRVYVDQQAGTTADVKFATCFSLLPLGGICDATGFGATLQSISATVTVPNNITLLCDPSTEFQPASAALNMFSQLEGSIIEGCFVDTTNLTYTGSVFNFLNYLTDNSHTYLRNIRIHAVSQTTGTAVTLKPPSGNVNAGIAFLDISHVRIQGMLNGFLFDGNGGFINGNHFEDLHVSQAVHGYNFNNNGAGTIEANHFVNISYQDGPSTTDGIRMASPGGGPILQNLFNGLNIWDTTTAINQLDANETSNRYVGHWDGAVNDFAAASSFDQLSSAIFRGPFTFNSSVSIGGLAAVAIVNSTGLQIFNVAAGAGTCPTAASVGAICTTAAITLPVAEPDTAYRVACTGLAPTNVPIVQTYTKSNTTFTITIAALTAAAATFTSYDCVVHH